MIKTLSQELSTIFAASEQRFDFIVTAEEKDKQISCPVLKKETQREITATLE